MAESDSQKRQIACKVRIKEIINGRFVQEEGWTPNYVETDDGRKVSRANIIGAVVAKEENGDINYNSIVVEDGTGKISLRAFKEDAKKLKDAKIGDVVLVIGRPREYGSERYILLEIIKIINDRKWIDVRRLEIEKSRQNNLEKEEAKSIEDAEEEVVGEEIVEKKEEAIHDKIIDYVRKLDKGNGVDFEDILKEFKNEDAIKSLLSEGELFEIRPGRVKVLE
jgi:RPA family protein